MVRSRTNSIGRAIAVLALGGVLAASFAISPSFSAINKTKVKKIVKNQNAIVSQDYPGGDIPGNAGFDLNNPNTIIGSLTVPKGNWYFHADFEVSRVSTGVIVICEMRAGGTKDTMTNWISGSQTQTAVSLQRTAAYPSGGTVDVRCDDGTAATTEADYSGLEIVAIEGSSLA